ncbi:hypothetical protein SNA80_15125, partial [Escherichia coli]|nr:hypothetical protein [Escherichia coli]
MFSALRHRTAALALGVCFILPVHASSPKPGDFAKEGANKRGNSSRLTQSFHFFMFEPIFSP